MLLDLNSMQNYNFSKMKYYVVAVLMMLMLFSTRTAASPENDVEDLILGIVKGAFEKEYENLETCIIISFLKETLKK